MSGAHCPEGEPTEPAWPSGCPMPSVLEAYARTGIAPAPHIVEHISSCSNCASFLEEARRNSAFLESIAAKLPARKRPDTRSWSGVTIPMPEIRGFQFVRELGRGGQGVVYEVLQEQPRRRAAVKMLSPGAIGSAKRRLRLEREAEIAASLRHPCIATIYEVLRLPQGGLAIVMELVEGVCLDQWAKARPIPTPITRHTAREQIQLIAVVCEAIAHAHRRGVIHRDLKPRNILVDADGHPRVLDFGVARLIDRTDSSDPLYTATGGFAGTPAYCSPEQVSGDPDQIDTRTDVYTLGLVLYELLTGRLPYEITGSLSTVVRTITLEPPRRPSPPPPHQGISEELWNILCMAMAKDPDRRYRGALAFRDDLVRYLNGEAIQAKQDSRLYRLKKWARRQRVAIAAGVLVVLLTTLAMWWLVQQRRESLRALSEKTVQGARLLARTGSVEEAERQLENEVGRAHLNSREFWRTALSGSPQRSTPLWALAEIAARQPRVATQRLILKSNATPKSATVTSGSIGVISLDGQFWRLSLPGLAVQRTEVDFSNAAPLALGLSPDLSTAAISTRDAIRLIRLADGSALETSFPSGKDPRILALGTGGRLICATDDGAQWIWEPEGQGRPRPLLADSIHPYRACFDPVTSGAFVLDPSGRVLLVNPDSGAVQRVIDLSPEARDELVSAIAGGDSTKLAISANGSRLGVAVGARAFVTSVVDTSSKWVPLPSHQKSGVDLQIASDGTIGVTYVPLESPVRVVDLSTATTIREIIPPADTTWVGINPDGTQVATMTSSGRVDLWYATGDPWCQCFQHGARSTNVVAFSPDGHTLITGLEDGRVLAWSLTAPDSSPRLVVQHAGVAGSVAFTPDGARIASIGYDGVLQVPSAAQELRPSGTPDGFARFIKTLACLAVDPRGRFIACAGQSPNVVLCSQDTGNQIRVLQDHQVRPASIAFSPDGRWLVWPDDNRLVVYDLDRESVYTVLNGHAGRIRVLEFSRDGTLLASGGDDQRVRLWSAKDWTFLREVSAPRESVFALSFHPGGLVLAGGGSSGTVRFWHVSDGRELASIAARGALILQLAFSPDGDSLAIAAGTYPAAQLWHLDRILRPVSVAPQLSESSGRSSGADER